MHRKPHLDERLAACSQIVTISDLAEKNMKKAAEKKDYLDFAAIFENDNPVCLEIGCGKGGFICELAKREPQLNFIAVEKISNVLIEGAERATAEALANVHFLNCAAEVLPRYIAPACIEKIYLNFSNPLPKKGYAKQRLTHPVFLGIYRALLKPNGIIVQKTDDGDFYAFSLAGFKECGFEVVEECTDLAALADPENIVTEHEKRFTEMGKNIYRLVVRSR